jgi:hypothetical protein
VTLLLRCAQRNFILLLGVPSLTKRSGSGPSTKESSAHRSFGRKTHFERRNGKNQSFMSTPFRAKRFASASFLSSVSVFERSGKSLKPTVLALSYRKQKTNISIAWAFAHECPTTGTATMSGPATAARRSMCPNPPADPVPFGHWTLRDKAAQRRSPARWTSRVSSGTEVAQFLALHSRRDTPFDVHQ